MMAAGGHIQLWVVGGPDRTRSMGKRLASLKMIRDPVTRRRLDESLAEVGAAVDHDGPDIVVGCVVARLPSYAGDDVRAFATHAHTIQKMAWFGDIVFIDIVNSLHFPLDTALPPVVHGTDDRDDFRKRSIKGAYCTLADDFVEQLLEVPCHVRDGTAFGSTKEALAALKQLIGDHSVHASPPHLCVKLPMHFAVLLVCGRWQPMALPMMQSWGRSRRASHQAFGKLLSPNSERLDSDSVKLSSWPPPHPLDSSMFDAVLSFIVSEVAPIMLRENPGSAMALGQAASWLHEAGMHLRCGGGLREVQQPRERGKPRMFKSDSLFEFPA